MRFKNDTKSFSATDLSTHSECEHRTVLEMGVALRKWDRPGQSEIRTELLEMRGREHEARVTFSYAYGSHRKHVNEGIVVGVDDRRPKKISTPRV